MSRIHVSMITLGVADVQAAGAFYEKLGLKRSAMSQDSVIFFDMGGLCLGLFGWDDLARDASIAADSHGFRGTALCWNRSSSDEVDADLDRFVKAGGKVMKPAEKVFWGGYSAYVSDPDGHLWEIAHNPFVELRANGAMDLAPPVEES